MAATYGKGKFNGGFFGENPANGGSNPPVYPEPQRVIHIEINHPDDSMPESVSTTYKDIYIDVLTMSEEMDLGNIQAPADMADGARMIIRKKDTSKYKIKLIDGDNTDYQYVDKQGETMVILYDKTADKLRLT